MATDVKKIKFVYFVYVHQRPFTSQLISKIYFLTFASYIEKLLETTNKTYRGLIFLLKTRIEIVENFKQVRKDVSAE